MVKYIDSYEDFREKAQSKFNFAIYDGFAASKTNAIWEFNFDEADKIYQNLIITKNNKNNNNEKVLNELAIAITGRLTLFKNRAELQNLIEQYGGKVVNAVSEKTNYLINNDVNSNSAKNNNAKKLGVVILTEKDFIEKFNLTIK